MPTLKKLSDIELLDDAVIGLGACSKVVRCRHREDGKVYALKIVDMARISELDGAHLRHEVELHRDLIHPNIVRYYDSMGEGAFVYVLLEYCSRNTLYFFIHVKHGLPDILALRFFYQTACAIQYMHSKNIIHRDIKPENLLMDENYNIKVCDMGWACKLTPQKPNRHSVAGTFEYMAPEVVFDYGHGYAADVWTLGILLYEMLHGSCPFTAESHEEMKREFEQRKVQYSMKVGKPTQELLNRILERDPSKRITVDQILSHPLITGNLNEFKRPLNEQELALLENNNYLNQLAAKRIIPKSVNGVPVELNPIKNQRVINPLLPGTEAIPRTELTRQGFAHGNVQQKFNPDRPDLEQLSKYTTDAKVRASFNIAEGPAHVSHNVSGPAGPIRTGQASQSFSQGSYQSYSAQPAQSYSSQSYTQPAQSYSSQSYTQPAQSYSSQTYSQPQPSYQQSTTQTSYTSSTQSSGTKRINLNDYNLGNR